MILDAMGYPLRRRIGFLPAFERETGGISVELVSAVAFSVVQTEDEAEGENEHDEQ